jgi:hypothetical protein
MTDVARIADDAAQAFVLHPGDTLVVRVHEDASAAELDEIATAIKSQVGDNAALVLGAGVEQVAARRAVESPRNRMVQHPGRDR